MRRNMLITVLLTLILTLSCNPNLNEGALIADVDSYSNPSDNPFSSAACTGTPAGTDGSFTFLMLSDTHFGKSEISRSDSAFLDWVEKEKDGRLKDVAFITNLGDLTDDSKEEQFSQNEAFMTSFESKLGKDIPFFPVIGNHDNRIDGPQYFQKLVKEETGVENSSYYRFDWGEVQFYVLDTSFRTLGDRQRAYFEEALATDDGNPKIVLSHVPLHGKTALIYASMHDSQEIRQLLVDMKRGGVGAYLSGHQHAGNILYSHEFDDSDGAIYEFIASCFFSGTSRKLTGRFYLCTYNHQDCSLTIQSYAYDSSKDSYGDTPDASFTLQL